jgi:hypothetical protein
MKANNKSHLFLSYARQDDKQPTNQMGQGWVTAFESELKKRYRQYTSRDIDIFFDKNSIGPGRDWKREIGKGLRESRLFLAFLSPNYFISENCLWEWDQYLQLEHSAARGDDGLTPIFFVTPDDLRLSEGQAIMEWLEAMMKKYHTWFAPRSVSISENQAATAIAFSKDVVQRRNVTAMFELQKWFEHGPDILLDLDAQARLLELDRQPRSDPKDLRTLSERLHSLDRHIAHRLDRLALADLAPGNVELSHEHFVGRHQELRKLHDIMVHGGPQSGGSGMGGRGMIAATFAPGGLGKTALARQYAHAYSEFYAAGGKWFIGCEGLTDLGAAFLKLVDNEQFQSLALLDRTSPPSAEDRYLVAPLELTEEQRKDNSRALERILAYMKRATSARGGILLEEFRRKGEKGELECHSKADDPPELERPRALVILDNVDKPELLSATELAQLTGSEWLEVIVTTRMSPDRFGGGDRIFSPLEINTLSHADSVRLLAEFLPDHRFASDQEEEASKRIAEVLGGWTIAVEIVAAFLGERARKGQSDTASAFLQLLEENGLAGIDDLSGKHLFDVSQRHSKAKDPIERARQNRISTMISWSIEQLTAPARTALEFASLLMPDEMPLEWIRDLTMDRHPEVRNADMVSEQDWISVWSELRSLRLLHPRSKMEVDKRGGRAIPTLVWVHRLVSEIILESMPRFGERADKSKKVCCTLEAIEGELQRNPIASVFSRGHIMILIGGTLSHLAKNQLLHFADIKFINRIIERINLDDDGIKKLFTSVSSVSNIGIDQIKKIKTSLIETQESYGDYSKKEQKLEIN